MWVELPALCVMESLDCIDACHCWLIHTHIHRCRGMLDAWGTLCTLARTQSDLSCLFMPSLQHCSVHLLSFWVSLGTCYYFQSISITPYNPSSIKTTTLLYIQGVEEVGHCTQTANRLNTEWPQFGSWSPFVCTDTVIVLYLYLTRSGVVVARVLAAGVMCIFDNQWTKHWCQSSCTRHRTWREQNAQ